MQGCRSRRPGRCPGLARAWGRVRPHPKAQTQPHGPGVHSARNGRATAKARCHARCYALRSPERELRAFFADSPKEVGAVGRKMFSPEQARNRKVSGYNAASDSEERTVAMLRKIKRYGWIPDLPDQRDFMYAAPLAALRALPPKKDLTGACPPVYDQGELGSCTANPPSPL